MRQSKKSLTPIKFETGGLGHLLVENVYEVWVCVADHACSDPIHEVTLPDVLQTSAMCGSFLLCVCM
jgi:hypothetical protein